MGARGARSCCPSGQTRWGCAPDLMCCHPDHVASTYRVRYPRNTSRVVSSPLVFWNSKSLKLDTLLYNRSCAGREVSPWKPFSEQYLRNDGCCVNQSMRILQRLISTSYLTDQRRSPYLEHFLSLLSLGKCGWACPFSIEFALDSSEKTPSDSFCLWSQSTHRAMGTVRSDTSPFGR